MRLLEPLDIKGMRLPNRVVVPAMVTRLCGDDGYVNEAISDRYVRYAQGGVGLIVVEAMAIHGSNAGPLLRISDDKFVPGLKAMTQRIHDTSDSKVVPQIIHFLKISRSGWRQTVEMLSTEDIDRIVEQFGHAAARAREAGFDGIELHNAHAYTLASFVSPINARTDAYSGTTLESRLHMIGRVMESVRRHVGHDFPVGIRYLADEFIRGGYTVEDAKLIGLRMARLGADYLSLSVGGKFEDAVHTPGQVLHGYSGYSGERCMPGAEFPEALHAPLAAEVRRYLRARGIEIPIVAAGKLGNPVVAERAIVEGQADLVGIARGLLADPDWVNKLRAGQPDQIIKCDYCNVCKQLDGAHMPVTCFLWPKGTLQAPPPQSADDAPHWPEGRANLTVKQGLGSVKLKWRKAAGEVAHYDVYRVADDEAARVVDGVRLPVFTDNAVLADVRYRYFVRACSAAGHASPPSETVEIARHEPSVQAADAIAPG
ncbi:MAG: NADH:flavin oxidoreductase [Sinobacteraceae bacterium]|jgi:2,4-dienoyl-CoA reductase-like NADH-dependent reductase (Old Yellow Enzyme family)|nr:NADH:flavin oxidoreductase [Burkholderiaceae bacterium]MCP5340060.1 NADH:flavin oxidoreductase [Nevskiaceae bacterium]